MSDNNNPEIEEMPFKMPTPVETVNIGQQEPQPQQEMENLLNDENIQTQSPVKETPELDKIPMTNNENVSIPPNMASQPLVQPLPSMPQVSVQPLIPNLVGDFNYNGTPENITSPLKNNSIPSVVDPSINGTNNETQENTNSFIPTAMPQPTSVNNNQTEQNINGETPNLPHENLFSPTDNLIDTVINNSKPNDSIMDETPINDHDLLETPFNMEANNSDSFGFVIPNNNMNNFVPPPQFQPQQPLQPVINPFEDPLNIIHDDSEINETNKIQNPINIMDSSIPPLQQPIETNVETPLNSSIQQEEKIETTKVEEEDKSSVPIEEVKIEQIQEVVNVVEEKEETTVNQPTQPEPLPEMPQPKDVKSEEINAEKLIITSDDIVSPVNIMDAVIHNQTHTSDNPNGQLQNEIDYNLIPSIQDESPVIEKPTHHHYEHHYEHNEEEVNGNQDHNILTEEIIKMPQPVNHENSTIPLEKPKEEIKIEPVHSNDEVKNVKNESGKIRKIKAEDKEPSFKMNIKSKLEKPKTTTSTSTVKHPAGISSRLTQETASSKLRNAKHTTPTTTSKSSIASSHVSKSSTTTNSSSSRLAHKPLSKSSISSSTTTSRLHSTTNPKSTTSSTSKTKTLPRMTSTSSTSTVSSPKASSLHKPSSISTSSHAPTRHSVSTSPRSSTLKSTTKTTKSSTSTSPVSSTTKSRLGVSSPASSTTKSRIGGSTSSSITKPKVSSSSSTTTPTSKTSRFGLTSRTPPSKISSTSRTISKSTTTPTSSRTPVKPSSTTPPSTSRLASRVKPTATTSTTMRKTSSTGITKSKSSEKTPLSNKTRSSSMTKSSSADKEIIEKQSKEIKNLEQKIKDLNDQIEEQLLISSVTSKQDLNNAINGLKENIKQLYENNNENNNIDEITNSINDSFGIIENFANLIESQEQNYGKLKVETAKLNQNLANVTLLCDEEHNKKLMDDEMYKNEIKRLQQMATSLNNSLSRVTLLCDEIKREQNNSGIEQLNTQIQNTEQPTLRDETDNPEVDRLRQSLANINSKLAIVTLLCDQINKEKKNSISNLEQQIEHFKNLTVELNNRITNLTFYCDQIEHEKSTNENAVNNTELSQELDEYKMMLEQKDLIIQQLQNQIEQLEQKSTKEENETMNQLIQENAALKLKVSELSENKTDNLPLDLTANPDEELEEEIIKVNGNE